MANPRVVRRYATALFSAAQQSNAVERVELSVLDDPALIGGMLVRIGDTVIDGSIRNYLHQLHARFQTALALGQSVVFAPGEHPDSEQRHTGDGHA